MVYFCWHIWKLFWTIWRSLCLHVTCSHWAHFLTMQHSSSIEQWVSAVGEIFSIVMMDLLKSILNMLYRSIDKTGSKPSSSNELNRSLIFWTPNISNAPHLLSLASAYPVYPIINFDKQSLSGFLGSGLPSTFIS